MTIAKEIKKPTRKKRKNSNSSSGTLIESSPSKKAWQGTYTCQGGDNVSKLVTLLIEDFTSKIPKKHQNKIFLKLVQLGNIIDNLQTIQYTLIIDKDLDGSFIDNTILWQLSETNPLDYTNINEINKHLDYEIFCNPLNNVISEFEFGGY